MRKVAAGIVCLLFMIAGIFGVGLFPSAATVTPEVSASVPSIPGLAINYHFINDDEELISQSITSAPIEALYNTIGRLSFTFHENAEFDIAVVVILDGEELSLSEGDYDVGNRIVEYYQWDYSVVGLYSIEVSVSVEDDEGDNDPVDIDFVIKAIARSDENPKFNGNARVRLFYDGERIGKPRTNWSGVVVKANSENPNFFWDESVTTYSIDSDEYLTCGEDDKYLILNQLSPGDYTITFTVHYYLRKINADGTSIDMVSQTAIVEADITVLPRIRVVTIWDVLITVGILGGLCGALWFVNRLSKNVEYQQSSAIS